VCAGEALKANITTLGPLVLPLSEQLLFAVNMLARKLLGRKAVRPYIPDFKLAFEHVCIHTGGRGVIDEIEKQLTLTPDYVEPSRATLYQFGNISSSSIWWVGGRSGGTVVLAGRCGPVGLGWYCLFISASACCMSLACVQATAAAAATHGCHAARTCRPTNACWLLSHPDSIPLTAIAFIQLTSCVC
jgi:hypothetical protein